MRSTTFFGLVAVALIAAAPLSQAAAASPQYVTCDDIAKGVKVQPSADGAGENWPAMANVVCSSIERMRQMSSIETKAEQDEIHRLYQTAVDGRALRLRAVPSCVSQTIADGDVEARVVKIVRGFIVKNGSTLQRSAAIRIMAAARWPEKLEGEVDTGQGEPVPVAWLFRCRSSSDCKIIDIQVTGSLSMTESIRGDLSTTAHCAK
jgi:hypothetical protein